jgi:pre-rRNA-processing protein IPI1
MEHLAQRISDVDKTVRSELHGTLTVVLPLLPSAMLGPFVPLLMAQISSALTHMLLEIRTDALQYLDLFTRHSPAVIVAGHLEVILHHFCDVLSQVRCISSVWCEAVCLACRFH